MMHLESIFLRNIGIATVLFIGSVLWPILNTQAFYHNPYVERSERRIQINTLNDTEIEVQILDVLKNTSPQPQIIQYYYPLPSHSDTPQIFFDARAIPFELLEGDERLNALFDQAAAKSDSRFFRLGSPFYQKLLLSDSLPLNPDEEVRIKLEWKMSSEFVNDFHFSEIFTEDDIPTSFFEVIYSLATQNTIHHFFTNLKFPTMVEKDQNQVVLLGQKENYKAGENLRFFWSHVPNPTLQYLTDETIYYGHFKTWEAKRFPEEILFLVDISGSMSDNIWNQTTKYLKFLLEKLEGQNVKIIFADESLYPYKETFELNSREFLRDFMEHIETIRPAGKSNIQEALLSLEEESWSLPKNKRAIVLITDQSISIPEAPDTISAPVITLHFRGSEDQTTKLLSFLTNGFAQRLFRSGTTLIEADELWSKWLHWTYPYEKEKIKTQEGETDLLPKKFTGKFAQESPLFIGRKFDSFATKYTPAADFLVRRWGALRIAQILRKENIALSDAQAISSILNRFGIQTSYLTSGDSPESTQKIIQELTPTQKILFLQELESGEPESAKNTKFYHSIPLTYQDTDFVWKSYDFEAKAKKDNLLQIAPFSLAQKQLFLQFPNLLATGFGIGEQTEFCTLFRCISVRYGYKENPELSDRAFLSDFNPHHWANPYILKLVERGIFKTALNGKIHPDRAIDRGEFLRMAYEIQKQKNELQDTILSSSLFEDIKNTSDFFVPAQYYAAIGVVKGYPDKTFRPYLELTRAEAIKILLSIKGVQPIHLKGQEPIFSDSSAWERPWVEEAYHRGWISGFEDGTFRPRDTITRASATKLLVEILLNQ